LTWVWVTVVCAPAGTATATTIRAASEAKPNILKRMISSQW
jgi:hypothetical protein